MFSKLNILRGIKCLMYQYWQAHTTFWYTTIDTEGWKIDNNVEMQTSYVIQLNQQEVRIYKQIQLQREFQKIFLLTFPLIQNQSYGRFSKTDVNYILNLDENQYNLNHKLNGQQIGIQSIEIQMKHSSNDLKLYLQSISKNQHT
ncbi:unnamed protein product [Paramecium sonneborni]|uniref:Uncharacterized protein n=1 Tax=Paramecium sonneborni TaxID=65129 RepID=A0A8S1L633_9CILI|nr:unnamed protein product [Paramecium sonneborni]